MASPVSPLSESRESVSLSDAAPYDGTALSPSSSPSSTDTNAPKVFMGQQPVLKNWKVYGDVPQDDSPVDSPLDSAAESSPSSDSAGLFDGKTKRTISERNLNVMRPSTPVWLQVSQSLAVFLTVAWFTYATIYILALPGSIKAILSSPLTLGGILASVLAPIAMLWLCIATWQRRSDAHIYAKALREELRGLFYPTAGQSEEISDDIRALMKQATEMSASSRGAIKAIQRARAGLRSEIRDFAGVSQKAEFHIDRLADSLSKRAEELLSLTETIEAQTEVISAKAQRGVQAWENVSAEVTELGDEIENIFDTGTKRLTSASDETMGKIQAIETNLSNAVETLTARIESVTANVSETQANFDSQTNRLETVSQSLMAGTTRLESSISSAEVISDAMHGVMQVMSESITKVEDTSQNLFARTESIEQKLEDKANILRSSAEKLLASTEGLENVGDIATHKLGEALAMAISGADTITNAVLRAKDMMDRSVVEASTQISETSKVADAKLEALMAEARANRDHLAQLIADIESKQMLFANSAQHIDESSHKIISAAEKATTALTDAMGNMLEKTTEPIAIITSTVESMDAKARELDDRLSVRVVEFGQQTGRLKALVDDVKTNLHDELQYVTETTEKVAQSSRSIGDSIINQKDNLTAIVRELQTKTEIVSGLLQDQAGFMNASLTEAESKVSFLGQTFFDKGDSLIQKASDIAARMNGFEQNIVQSLLTINTKSAAIGKTVEEQLRQFNLLNESIGPQSRNILTEADKIVHRYTDLRQLFVSTAEDAAACMIEMGDRLDSRIEKMGHDAADTSKTFLSVTEGLATAMHSVRRASEDAQEKMNAIQSGVQGKIDDLQIITEQVKNKFEALQNNLGGTITDLDKVVIRATESLDDASAKFQATTAMLDEKAFAVTSKILESTQQYVEEGHRMSLMGEQAVHKSSRIIAGIQEESERLVNAAKASLSDLQKSGDTISIRTKEIEEYLRSSIAHARTYGEELRNQSTIVAGQSAEIVQNIAEATLKLTARAQEVRQASVGVASEIEQTRVRLADESHKLGTTAKKTIDAADEAAVIFSKHTEALQKSVDDMLAKVRSIRDEQSKSERDSFLAASKFVIESLYSLAIDVARHLEGDLDMRVLRAYQRGDVSAYARHLVDIVPKIPTERTQRKFIDDGEFRTYILRFIRQYEELLEQAQSNDYSDLLNSVFSSSDVGKLYKMLCEIAGRNAKEH